MLSAMRLVAICMALGGCQVVFPYEAGEGPEDVPLAPSCPEVLFDREQSVVVRGLEDIELSDGALAGEELWFTQDESDVEVIKVALRDQTGTYGLPVRATFGDPTSDESDANLSGDGHTMVFRSTRNGGSRAFQVTRPTRKGPFGNPIDLPDLPTEVTGVDLSFDGLAIYFSAVQPDDSTKLFVARRASRDVVFDAPVNVTSGGEDLFGEFPSISPDELELYYVVDPNVNRRTRATVNDEFGAEELVLDGDDPDVSSDGETLIFSTNDLGELRLIHRTCE